MAKKINELTIEELKKRKMFLLIIAWFLIVVLLLLFYLRIRDGEKQSIVIPLALSPMVIILGVNIKKITDEIKNRS